MENEKTVFANQNTLYAFISFFFNFSVLAKTCKRNKSREFSNEKVPRKLAGPDFLNICQDPFNWQNRRNVHVSVDNHD